MSITSANAIFMLAIPGLFPTPVQLQQFAAEDIFDTGEIAPTEVVMGVDGVMTAGFVFVPLAMNISLQADSPSNVLFDAWWATMYQTKDVLYASGLVVLNSTGSKYTLIKGSLTGYKAVPDAKKHLQPRRHTITWQNPIPAVA
jgi:hypothetical protein